MPCCFSSFLKKSVDAGTRGKMVNKAIDMNMLLCYKDWLSDNGSRDGIIQGGA